MRAELEIECKNPDDVIKAVRPDMAVDGKFSAGLEALKNGVRLSVESKDMAGLLAGINSYARLIRTALDIEKLEG